MEDRKIIFTMPAGADRVVEIETLGEFSDKDLYSLYSQLLVGALKDTPPVERMKATRAIIAAISHEVATTAAGDAMRNPEVAEDVLGLVTEILGDR